MRQLPSRHLEAVLSYRAVGVACLVGVDQHVWDPDSVREGIGCLY